MSTILIVDAKLKPESISKAIEFFAEIVPDTRAFEGCESIDVCIDSEDSGNLVLVEKWVSMEHYKKYHHWREETGVLDQIRALLDGPVSRRVLNVAA
jgi:quinol monooxygenase YgiN